MFMRENQIIPVGLYSFKMFDYLISHQNVKQGSATYGPPSKIIRPAAPLQIVGTARPRSGIIFYESALLATFVVHTYEKPYCARDALYVVFRPYVMKCESQQLID